MKTLLGKRKSFIDFLFTALISGDVDIDINSGDKLINEPLKGKDNGDIWIKSGSAITEIKGGYVWETISDDGFVFVSDQTNTSKGLIISFNITSLPVITTTYKIVENGAEEVPNQIDILFSEYKTVNAKTSRLQWRSTDQSGELTLEVDDDKITANLDGIILKPELNPTRFKSLNVGEYAKLGVLYGSFTMEGVKV